MKLSKVLLSAGVAAIPINVLALGLGSAELDSALNEPLEARIDLYSVKRSELADIKATLASPEEFQKAGLEYTHGLTNLRFRVQTGPDGKPYISVTSRQPVREPFLNFLLEVNWPTGRLLREYTMLLDPPVYGAAMEKAVRPAVAAAPRGGTQAGTPDASRATGAAAPAGVLRDGRYGPVQRNDTLWSIAAAARPDPGVSVQQAMLAIVEANPEAFVNGNVNALKQGFILRIPERSEMTGRTRQEALAEVRRQYAAWKEQRLDTGATPGPGAPAPAGRAAPEAADEEARLKLVSPGSGERGAGAGGTGDAQESLMLAEEALSSAKAENAELKSRLAETEAMLADFERLLALKNENIAELQRRLRQEQYAVDEGAAGAEAPVPPAEPETAEMAEAPAGDEMADDAVDPLAALEQDLAQEEDMAPAAAQESEAEAMDPLAALEQDLAAEGAGEPGVEAEEVPVAEEAPPAPAEPPVMEEAPPAPAEPAEPAKRAPILPPPAAPEPAGLLDSLPVSPAILGAGVGGILLLLAGGLFLRRKRAGQAEHGLEEAPAAVEPAGAVAPAPAAPALHDTESTARLGPEEAGGEEPAVEERTHPETLTDTLVQDTTRRDDDALDEVNVYLAYERYDQAEQLVRKALEKHPDNEAYHLKLLEIHHTAKNKEGFRKDAPALLALVGAGAPAMAQAEAWWNELAPGTPLVAEEAGGPEGEFERTQTGEVDEAAAAAAAGGALDFDLAGDETAEGAVEQEGVGGEPPVEDLDFDLGFEEEGQRTMERATGEVDLALEGDARSEDMELDFDLGETGAAEGEEAGGLDLGLDEEGPKEDAALDFDLGEVGAGEGEEAGGLDLDLDLGEGAEEDQGLDFDLGELGAGEGEEAGGLDLDLDLSEGAEEDQGLDFDLSEAGAGEDEEARGLDLDLDLGGDEGAAGEAAPEPPLDLGLEGPEEAGRETSTVEEALHEETGRLDTVALDNLDMDLGADEEPPAERSDEAGLDLDFSDFEEQAADTGEEEKPAIDFSAFEEPAAGAGEEEKPAIDFSGFEEPAAGPAEEERPAIDFSAFEEPTAGSEADTGEGGEGGAAGAGEEEGPEIDFDLDLGFEEDEEPARTLALEGEGDIDEVGTKLDLAQAYMDMGNADGARTILNEVVAEGNDTQKAEAEALLDRLAQE